MSNYDVITSIYAGAGQVGTSDRTLYYTYSSMPQSQKNFVAQLLQGLDPLIDNDFAVGTLISSHITVHNSNLSLQGADGITTHYSTTSKYSDIAIDTDLASSARAVGVTEDQYMRYVLAHEVGHALGLKHPFDAQGSNTAVNMALTPLDTIMAYVDQPNEVVDWYRPLDIAALIAKNGIEDDPQADGDLPIYRFYSETTGSHFFTVNKDEATAIATQAGNLRFEGSQFYANAAAGTGLVPVYRFVNTNTHDHFFTRSEEEKATVMATLHQYEYEGIGFYAKRMTTPGTEPVYRFFNDNTEGHFFTSSVAERDNVINNLSSDYHYEGIAFYV